MDLLRDVKRRKLRIKIIAIVLIIIAIIITAIIIINIRKNRENKLINRHIMNASRNAVITINNDMSRIRLYDETLKNIRENNKTIQVSNNEAKIILNSNELQQYNKVNAKVNTTNKYKEINNVICIEIDVSGIKRKELISKILVDTDKLNLTTEYVDVYAINNNNEFCAYMLKKEIFQDELYINFDTNMQKYIVAYVPVIDLNFNYNEIIMKKGEEIQLTCDLNDNATNSQLHAQVKDPNIIEVTSNGVIKAINAGETQLTIQSYKNTATRVINVIVKDIPEEIKVKEDKVNIDIQEEYQIELSVLPETLENKKVKYTSLNTNVATVDQSGKINGIKKGKTKIKITTEETPEISREIEVTVEERALELRTQESEIEILENETYNLNVSVLPETLENKKVKYSTSDSSVVTVNSKGKIKGISEGVATITITTDLKPKLTVNVVVYVKKLQIQEENIEVENHIENNIIQNIIY